MPQLDPRALLVISRALAALGPSLIALLVIQAAQLSGGGESPISFCNVLFIGNLCAAMVVVAWFGLGSIWRELAQLDRKLWFGLVVNGCLAALLSALIFSSLQYTSVTNAILLARFGPVLYALVGAVLLKQSIRKWEWAGFSLIVVGILAIVLKSSMFQLNRGDLLILGSSVVYAASSLLGKLLLSGKCPRETVVFSRNAISAISFFFIANILFGPDHFADAFRGQLWILMTVYALFIIVLAQFTWYAALEKLDTKTVGKWTVLSPVFGVLYALILHGERPSSIQISAFVVIMAGVLISSYGKRQPLPKGLPDSAETSVSAS